MVEVRQVVYKAQELGVRRLNVQGHLTKEIQIVRFVIGTGGLPVFVRPDSDKTARVDFDLYFKEYYQDSDGFVCYWCGQTTNHYQTVMKFRVQ